MQFGKDTNAPIATGAGAAGRAEKGFYDLSGQLQKQKHDEQVDFAQLQNQSRTIDNASRLLALNIDRFHANEDARKVREDRLARRDRGQVDASRDALNMLGIANDNPDVNPAGGEGWGGFPGMTPVDPVQGVLDHARQRAQDPNVTPEEASALAKSAATIGVMAVKKRAGMQFARQLKQEVASGYWQESQALGVDIDDDGTPDAIAQVPQHMLARLEAGENPAVLGKELDTLKRKIDTRRGALKHRAQVLAETDQQIQSMPNIEADDAAELEHWNSKWERGEFGDTPEGEAQYREGVANMAAGNRPITIKVGAKPVQVFAHKDVVGQIQQAQIDAARKEATDPIARQTKMLSAVVGALGKYQPTITTTDEDGKRVTSQVSADDYLAKVNATGRKFFPKNWQDISGDGAASPQPGDMLKQAEDAAASSDEAWTSFVQGLPNDVNVGAIKEAGLRGRARRKQ